MTIVHLVRHGEVYNPDHILYGRLPGYQLSLRGRQQADVAARYLAARPIGLHRVVAARAGPADGGARWPSCSGSTSRSTTG